MNAPAHLLTSLSPAECPADASTTPAGTPRPLLYPGITRGCMGSNGRSSCPVHFLQLGGTTTTSSRWALAIHGVVYDQSRVGVIPTATEALLHIWSTRRRPLRTSALARLIMSIYVSVFSGICFSGFSGMLSFSDPENHHFSSHRLSYLI